MKSYFMYSGNNYFTNIKEEKKKYLFCLTRPHEYNNFYTFFVRCHYSLGSNIIRKKFDIMPHTFYKLLATSCAVGALFCLNASPSQAQNAPAAQKVGTLIEKSPLPATLSLPDAGAAYHISYLSTNGITQQGLVPVTGEVILPAGKPPKGGWPIVAWAHGTVGVNPLCAPSLSPFTERNRIYLSAWMKRGFAVVATDYQGLGPAAGTHAYLDTRVEAYSVLDSVRAALSAFPLKNKIMIVGQSQGGGAAVASASFAPTYAPDLDVRGTVATGVPYLTPELVSALLQPNPKSPAQAGYNPLMVYSLYLAAGLAGRDNAFKPDAAFSAKALPAYDAASKLCVTQLTDRVKAEGLNFQNSTLPGFSAALAPAMQNMRYPTLKLAQPLFVGTGSEDKDVPPALQLGLVKAACAAGTVVQSHIYPGLNHSETVNASLPDSAAFTKAVMSGKAVKSTCSTAE